MVETDRYVPIMSGWRPWCHGGTTGWRVSEGGEISFEADFRGNGDRVWSESAQVSVTSWLGVPPV